MKSSLTIFFLLMFCASALAAPVFETTLEYDDDRQQLTVSVKRIYDEFASQFVKRIVVVGNDKKEKEEFVTELPYPYLVRRTFDVSAKDGDVIRVTLYHSDGESNFEEITIGGDEEPMGEEEEVVVEKVVEEEEKTNQAVLDALDKKDFEPNTKKGPQYGYEELNPEELGERGFGYHDEGVDYGQEGFGYEDFGEKDVGYSGYGYQPKKEEEFGQKGYGYKPPEQEPFGRENYEK